MILKKDTVVMISEPIPDITIDMALEMYNKAKTEQEIADIYAMVDNQALWLAHDVDDYEEETKEYENICKEVDNWFELMYKIETKIAEILKNEGIKIPKKGRRKTIEQFMQRNGYRDGDGWWIEK